MGIISFTIKSGVIYSAYYYTKIIGVWGPQVESEKIYNNVKDLCKPHWKNATKNINFTLPTLPAGSETSYLLKHYYNQGVKNTIYYIHMAPCLLGQFISKTKETITKSLDAPPVKQ
ncbi:MICOS complex subunit MIC13 homolog QIL1 [Condylostylus longicornis]|uniref:MICOS complex subunit MIC13 homolog QIL1 n=1 Tax=Condylostylus longicornis TaxID=2530218 RepID=UPI00244E1F21|nr:MICOS complex subunit MIC13 homolog QIL1 [Condylostylus longicornis]